ncbi:MAG: class I SAM-dependent methyltransferase [Planctomycetes bacterium]|nr:class I SAM-dependent methyltransferase [Planctomycetota bacterium]
MSSFQWQLEKVPCDYCGSPDADVLLRGRDRAHGLPGEFNVVMCTRCGLVRTNPRPTAACLAEAYPDTYREHQAADLAEAPPRGLLRWALVNRRGYPLGPKAPAALRLLAAPLAAAALAGRRAAGYVTYQGSGRLLDFGCGVGRYVARMVAAGWQAQGIDASPAAVAIGRQAGLALGEGTLPGADLAPESFDVVTMWQALEHVPSPKATLNAVARLLVPGGRLLVVGPRLDSLEARWFGAAWFGLELPRHLTHFTASTLRRHLEVAGFEVERWRGVRRPAILRRSFAQLADETGSRWHRRLARSRLVPGVLSWVAAMARRTGQMMCLARRR